MYPTSTHAEHGAEPRGLLVPLAFCALSWAGLIGAVMLL